MCTARMKEESLKWLEFRSNVYADVQYIKIDSRERIEKITKLLKKIAMISEINVNSSNAVDCILGPNVNEIPTWQP